MALLRNLRTSAFAAIALTVFGAAAAKADCPAGSGIQFPELTDSQFQCQQTTLLATLDFITATTNARQDCFSNIIFNRYPPDHDPVDCMAQVTNDSPGTTGDPDIDRRLRAAEADLSRRVLVNCTNVDLSALGFPGFCDDATPLTPYTAFDHNLCLLDRGKRLSNYILDVEHPPYPGDYVLTSPEMQCADDVARQAAHLPYQEIDARSRCILAQIQRDLALPPKIDCLREVDPQYPNTGRGITDNNVVEAHNHVLRSIPNSCPTVNIENIGFPHRCEFQNGNSVFPLPALTECMFDTHHADVFRFIDVMFPCSTKCGNGYLNVEEDCDDGDNLWSPGELCHRDCSRALCGDPNDDGKVNIIDALYVLRASVGLEPCSLLICDVTGDHAIRAADALRLLQYAVHLPVTLNCATDLSTTCGNGYLESLEDCDDGDTTYVRGDYCDDACLGVPCGDTDRNGRVSVADAQYILFRAVGIAPCAKAVCDVTGNGSVNSTDALRALMYAVGLPVPLQCPAPPETPVAPPIE